MHVLVTDFNQNPNVGLYGFANDKFCLLAPSVPDGEEKKIEEVLNVPCYRASVFESELLGVFIAGNNDFIIVPRLNEEEKAFFEELSQKHDIKVIEFQSKFNAFGNNMVVKDSLILVNPDYTKKDLNELEKLLKENEIKIEIRKFGFENMPTIGSAIKVSSRGVMVGYSWEDEFEKLENEIGEFFVGSVLNGSPFVSSGILVNKNGFIAGKTCTGIELGMIDEAFGFLENQSKKKQ